VVLLALHSFSLAVRLLPRLFCGFGETVSRVLLLKVPMIGDRGGGMAVVLLLLLVVVLSLMQDGFLFMSYLV